MKKKQKQYHQVSRLSKNKAITIASTAIVVSLIAYFGLGALTPVNSSTPVFGAPRHVFIKALGIEGGQYAFFNQASGSVKGMRASGNGGPNPMYTIQKDSLETIQFINSAYQSGSKHNFNIDEFNVHSRDLGYFESQSITFVADKAGMFEYYCSLHPEMKGTVVVEDHALGGGQKG